MMSTFGVFEAKDRFGELLAEVKRGGGIHHPDADAARKRQTLGGTTAPGHDEGCCRAWSRQQPSSWTLVSSL